jgi:hypothetical protein
MAIESARRVLSDVLRELVARAVERDVPLEVAEHAAAATVRGIHVPDGPVTLQTARRIEAYFSSVVRRRVVGRHMSRRATAYFVLSSVVEDLKSTGRTAGDIWDELQRGWSNQVPSDVLEEYRLQLRG